MAAPAGNLGKEHYRFGPFSVDPDRELLLCGDQAVAITPKAFQILLVLLQHGQEIVTKEELMNAVWPDTFVEEANLSRNIFLLRKALGETPQDHRFIVTVPGRGYRLAEAVHRVGEQEISLVAAARSDVKIEVTARRARWPWVLLCIAVALVIATTAWRVVHRSPVLTERDTVVLADFANATGDPVFDETLRQGMKVQLEQSPFLSIVSDDRIQQSLKLMGRAADVRLTPEVAREVCERIGSAAVLQGSIVMLGSRYVLGLGAQNCRTGESFADEQAQIAKKEDVLNALGKLATDLRRRLGESLPTVQRYSTPLEQATTPSLDALKAYSSGVRLSFTSGFAAGIPLLERAVSLDPKFALAYAHLGLWYSGLDESDRAAASTTQAYALRDGVSEREKYFIGAMYERDVTGNLEASRQTLELWSQTYPRDVYVHGLLSGFSSQGTGRYEQSIDEAKRAIALDPDFTPAYINWSFGELYRDRLDAAEVALQKAADRRVTTPELVMLRYYLAFLKGDGAGMQRAADLAGDTPGAADWMAFSHALAMARSGQPRGADAMLRRALDIALQAKRRERAATFLAGAAVWQALLGDSSASIHAASAALQLSKARDVEYAAAFALALAGESARARTLAQDLQNRFPQDTSVQTNYLPALQALLALRDGLPDKAIVLLQPATPHELAVTALDFNDFYGGLYPIYVRGMAFAALHKDRESAVEFEKILQHQGLAVADPISSLALLQAARAYARAGETQKAKSTYQDLRARWKNADPGLALLGEARREHAKLP